MSLNTFAKENRTGFKHTVFGFLMGSADVVPGVSGGTVALILGIYERLICSVSAFDLKLLGLISQGKLRDAFKKVDAGFLLFLLSGVGIAVISFAKLIVFLLIHHPTPTWSVFLGLILASSWVVFNDLRQKGFQELCSAIIGGAISFWIAGLNPAESPDHLLYIFFCGMVSICAMILPGISGSFILVLMGRYQTVMQAIKGLDFSIIIVFGAGAAIGIITFSKILKWILKRHYSVTLAMMCGLMIGSLRKVWPFKEEILGEVHNVLPDPGAPGFILASFLCLGSLILVVFIERISRKGQTRGADLS